MRRDLKLFVVLAPVCLGGMAYALTQGDWWTAGVFALLVVVMFVLCRSENEV